MTVLKEKIKLFLIDDHHLIRDGLKSILKSTKNYEFIVDEAECGKDALKKIKQKDYDIIITDYQLQDMNGKELVESILLYKSESKILVLSNHSNTDYVTSIIDAGAKGYILKDIEPFELIHAIKTILSNKIYYSSSIAVALLDTEKNSQDKKTLKYHDLTKREIQILRLIAQEKTNTEIADILFIAKRTVETHRHNLINKLDVKNSIGLIKLAYEMKLIE
jgi:DNA-binding NarL/FixJ family response regulator